MKISVIEAKFEVLLTVFSHALCFWHPALATLSSQWQNSLLQCDLSDKKRSGAQWSWELQRLAPCKFFLQLASPRRILLLRSYIIHLRGDIARSSDLVLRHFWNRWGRDRTFILYRQLLFSWIISRGDIFINLLKQTMWCFRFYNSYCAFTCESLPFFFCICTAQTVSDCTSQNCFHGVFSFI